jgi:DNA-binding HxlR family transcriptional regulator/N-acetylglutamate synthase-like GNAT family acetyltransferase
VTYYSQADIPEKQVLSGHILTFRYILLESLNKKNLKNKRETHVGFMVESIIGCKWSLAILQLLRNGINRPGEIQRKVDGLTTKVLNERLVKLARFGIIDKIIYPEAPPRVEYFFTEFGESFLEIVDVIEKVQKNLDEKNPDKGFYPVKPESPRQLIDYYDLRWRILRAPWHQPPGSEKDEFEETAEHLAIQTSDGKIIGTGRLHKVRPDEAQIRYMAVEENYRGQGVGEMIYKHLESIAMRSGIKRIIVNARLPAVGFYERQGFRVTADGHTLFDEIKHKVMEKDL